MLQHSAPPARCVSSHVRTRGAFASHDLRCRWSLRRAVSGPRPLSVTWRRRWDLQCRCAFTRTATMRYCCGLLRGGTFVVRRRRLLLSDALTIFLCVCVCPVCFFCLGFPLPVGPTAPLARRYVDAALRGAAGYPDGDRFVQRDTALRAFADELSAAPPRRHVGLRGVLPVGSPNARKASLIGVLTHVFQCCYPSCLCAAR